MGSGYPKGGFRPNMQQVPRSTAVSETTIGLIAVDLVAATIQGRRVTPLSSDGRRTLVKTSDPKIVRDVAHLLRLTLDVGALSPPCRVRMPWSGVDRVIQGACRQVNWASIRPKNLVAGDLSEAVIGHLVHSGALVPLGFDWWALIKTPRADRWEPVDFELDALELDAWEASRRLELHA